MLSFKAYLLEGKVVEVTLTDLRTVKVFERPLKAQINNLLNKGSLRFVIDKAGTLFVWDAWHAIHYEVVNALREYGYTQSGGYGGSSPNDGYISGWFKKEAGHWIGGVDAEYKSSAALKGFKKLQDMGFIDRHELA